MLKKKFSKKKGRLKQPALKGREEVYLSATIILFESITFPSATIE
jgi:hypothetical protein